MPLNLSGLRLLLLEDNPDDVAIVAAALEECGFDPDSLSVATTLGSALEQLALGAHDLILTDLNVPDSFGLDTVDALRGSARDLPLVVLTGVSEPETGISALQEGAEDYIPKAEVTGSSLSRSIRYAIERTRARRELNEAVARFRAAFDDSPLGMLIIGLGRDNLGRLLQVNDAFLSMTGYLRDELSARSLFDLLLSEDREADEAALRGLAEGAGHLLVREERLARADGERIWVHARVSAVTETANESYAIGTVQDVTESRLAGARLEYQALHDPLTGLANRRLVLDRLSEALRGTGGGLEGVALFFIDVDGFKLLNDKHGHGAGDDVLVAVAKRISRVVRAGDTVGRFGGDEFVVLCPGIPNDAVACAMADRLVQATREAVNSSGTHFTVTASIGLGTCYEPGADPDGLLLAADSAMYEAKRSGGDCWR